MLSPAFNSFPVLPTELRDLILETALLHETKDLWRFLVLSRDTSLWMELCLYDSVVLQSDTHAEMFFHHLKVNATRCDSVKALCVTHWVNHQMGTAIVELCSNLRRLAYWCAGADGEGLQSILLTIKKPLLSLSGWFSNCPIQLGSEVYRSLQYLEVVDVWVRIQEVEWNWEELDNLKQLRCLILDELAFVDVQICAGVTEDGDRARILKDAVQRRFIGQTMPYDINDGSDEDRFEHTPEGRILCILHPAGEATHRWWLHTVGEGLGQSGIEASCEHITPENAL